MGDKMPEGLGKIELGLIRRVQRQNEEKAQKLAAMKSKNKRTGLLIAGLVSGIYMYSMYAIKQEKILDELDTAVQQNKN